MNYQVLEIPDFSGGLTDYPAARGTTFAQKNRNLILDVDNRYTTRPGSSVDGVDEDRAFITSPVNALLAPLTAGSSPYRLTTGGGFGKLFYDNGSIQTELLGPTSKHLFTAAHASAADQRFSSAYWNGHHYIASGSFTQKVQKVYIDSLGAIQLRTAGLPQPTNSATITPTAGSGSYKYLFCWKYTYNVGPRTFITRSKSRRFIATSAALPITIADYPQWTGGTNDNYDTANLVMEVYRSESLGNTFYLLTTIAYADVVAGTDYIDSTPDASVSLNLPFYANGGTTEVDDVPVVKFTHVTERGTAFYGYALDGSDVLPNRIFQSVPGIPDACPRTFFVDLNDDVTGISSFRGMPVFFDRGNCYRGEGGFERANVGNLLARRYDESGGCVSHASIVQTSDGIFFAGDDGFYWTDGYKKLKISEEINQTWALAYPNDAAKQAIVGAYDPLKRLVYWNFNEDTNSDAIFVLHLRFGVKPDSVFSTIGGNFNGTPDEVTGLQVVTLPATMTQNFRASCLLYTNQLLYRGDQRGYVFFFDKSKQTDPRVDVNADTTDWGSQAIPYDLRTAALDFGSDAFRKWTPRVAVKLRNSGDISLLIRSERDQEGVAKNCKEVKHKTSVAWGEPGVLWGDPALYESDAALYDDQRHLPAPGIRCTHRTLWLSNAFTIVQKSDNLGTATLGTGVSLHKSFELTDVSEIWPDDILDYFISFDADGYENKYLITARTDTTITLYDPNGAAPPNGVYKWVMRGYARNQVLSLKSLNLPYAQIQPEQGPYRPGTEGSNA